MYIGSAACTFTQQRSLLGTSTERTYIWISRHTLVFLGESKKVLVARTCRRAAAVQLNDVGMVLQVLHDLKLLQQRFLLFN